MELGVYICVEVEVVRLRKLYTRNWHYLLIMRSFLYLVVRTHKKSGD
jgi:hypothetical protein